MRLSLVFSLLLVASSIALVGGLGLLAAVLVAMGVIVGVWLLFRASH